MRIQIVPINENPKELAIIELQGKLLTRTDSYEGLTFGPLKMEGERATLTIGNHLLHGKYHKLKKPLAVLRRGDQDGIDMVAVIKAKIVFSDRPAIIFPE